jgi:di/tricarboxylate transporter
MPLAFGAILGGSCTLIGTSTNLAVSGAMQRYGMEPYSMFELTSVGVIMVAVGLAYMLLVGIRLLPNRGGEESLTEQYHIREYISEVFVAPGSHLIGKTLGEANINLEFDLNVIGIIRGREERVAPSPTQRVELGDLLIVQGKIADILNIKSAAGLEIKADFKLNDRDLESGDVELFEVMVMRDSSLVGQTLKTADFRQNYNLTVLAINRHGETFLEKISTVRLRFGDVLLVQGNRALIEPFVTGGEMLLLEDVSASSMRTAKRRWAIAAFGLFLALSLSKLVTGYDVPLAVAVLLGVLLLLATQTVRHSELYSLIDFRCLF